ncbi:MAG: radical SAM protein [Deltaproteobacteria bacterium]|nr:radical SAM protein [Deltaproteobacteria bacterium]
MIRYVEPVIRPPSEADALILQATIGCSHNKCAFCVTYRDKPFRARPREELLAEIDWAGMEMPEIRKIFLGDGDALALSTNRLIEILERLRDRLPNLRRITAYASPQNFKNKSPADLKRLRQAGLNMLYVGLESGDDEVLKRIDKGTTADEMARLCMLPKEAGIKLFVTTVLGLGGPRLSQQHAEHTARLIDRIQPRFASALTLTLMPREPSYEEVFSDPEWRLLTPDEVLVECRQLIECIESRGIIFYTDHASNYVPLKGTLQKDKARMLSTIDSALADPNKRRPEFMRGL